MGWWQTRLDQLLELVFPERCGCGALGLPVCAACLAALRPFPPEQRPPPAGVTSVCIALLYDHALRSMIHQLKYRRRRKIAAPLGALLGAHVVAQRLAADAVIAVPLHSARQAQRGYNQAEELARGVAAQTGLPLLHGIARQRATEQQAKQHSQAERAANISGAFVWASPQPPPARVLLVDDVLSTGATIAACALAIRAAGAQQVHAVALARSRNDLGALDSSRKQIYHAGEQMGKGQQHGRHS